MPSWTFFDIGKCCIALTKQEAIDLKLGTARTILLCETEAIDHRRSPQQNPDSNTLDKLYDSSSMTTLCTKKEQVFVVSRVGEFLDQPTLHQWRHVKGSFIPADIWVSVVTVSELLESEWPTGPV